MTVKIHSFGEKTHGSVAPVQLVFLYLLASLALKDGTTKIGDTLFPKSFPLGSIPAFYACSPFEP
jgi:hypothetical protein